MSWSASKIFVSTIEDMLENTTAIDLNSDGFLVALYDDTPTPDQTVASANTAYDVAQWASANEVSDGTNWDAGGEPLDTPTFAPTSNVLTFDATDTVQGGASCTLADVYGCLVYDSSVSTPVDNQGISFHYFGGVQSVSAGNFTIVWHSSGIFALTL